MVLRKISKIYDIEPISTQYSLFKQVRDMLVKWPEKKVLP